MALQKSQHLQTPSEIQKSGCIVKSWYRYHWKYRIYNCPKSEFWFSISPPIIENVIEYVITKKKSTFRRRKKKSPTYIENWILNPIVNSVLLYLFKPMLATISKSATKPRFLFNISFSMKKINKLSQARKLSFPELHMYSKFQSTNCNNKKVFPRTQRSP
jgi:hypothetical protein